MSEYITVVSVDLHQPKCQLNGSAAASNSSNIHSSNNSINDNHEKKSSFVTVLSINNNQNTTTISTSSAANESPINGEIVTVYRLAGERLGFGLKFQGGTKTNEKVERLFIQSCDPDTPAARARTSWGCLSEGDEILQIDHEPITNMTRIECVKCLKDRNVAINLLVKKGDRDSMSIVRNDSIPAKRPPPPPQIPPRKIHKKPPPPVTSSSSSSSSGNYRNETNQTPILISQQPKPSLLMMPMKIISETPVAAEMYLNCTLDDELNRNDESDETGSTISSQISVISNFSSESDLSLLSSSSTTTAAATHASSNSASDLTRILTKPFQMIEREFNVNSTNIVNSTAPMSIDNLLLFNESELSEFNSNSGGGNNDIKVNNNNYVNVAVSSSSSSTTTSTTSSSSIASSSSSPLDDRQYENVDIKVVPPVPRPRSISLPQEAIHCEIDATTTATTTTPTNTTIESWLNDAKAINGNAAADKNRSIQSDDAQTYEPIKFECFAAADDDDIEDDKREIYPPAEFLNISEAYFNNFPWCSNTNSLPTIGESEEEFSSLEHFASQKIINGPIFIVHDTDNNNKNSNEITEAMCHHHHQQKQKQKNMEINNNNENSPYLHVCEDKSDNLISPHVDDVHCSKSSYDDKDICATKIDANGCSLSAEKEKSFIVSEKRRINDISKSYNRDSECDTKKMESRNNNDSDECAKAKSLNERTKENKQKTFNLNESAKSTINNKNTIKCDSERLDSMEISSNISIASQHILDIDERNVCEVKQSNDDDDVEIKTDSKETATTIEAEAASASSLSHVNKNNSNINEIEDYKMEQKQQQQLLPSDRKIDSAAVVEKATTMTMRTATDGFENIAMKRTSSLNHLQQHTTTNKFDNSNIDSNKFSQSTTPKATAIVAPQRKSHHFEEITNFIDTKPPFKSATLGRQRSSQLNWRNKDEKSEKSVKDKIAMFSNSTSDISHILPKTPTTSSTSSSSSSSTTLRDKSSSSLRSGANFTKSTENIFSSDNAKLKINGRDFCMKKKAMSVENLDDYDDDEVELVDDDDDYVDSKRDFEMMNYNYTPVSKPMSHHRSPLMLNMNRAQSVEHLNSPALPSSRPPSLPPPLSAPISSQLTRRISFNGYINDNNNSNRRQDDHTRIANILENRKKSMSKLRGLVIPEKVPESELHADQKVFNLPVIRSKECELIDNIKSASTSPSLPVRKTFKDFEYHNLVKPAPRKSLEDDKLKIIPPIKPPRTSLIFTSSSKSPSSLNSSLTMATDESDTESSSRFSTPPISPVAKKPLIRTLSSNSSLSSNSTLTSGSAGSQASCSSNVSNSPETRKSSTDTTTSTATTTRKSIVASSKSRSGRECLDKSWRDEDSTDGGIDNDEKQRVPKAKTRSSLINYKLVNHGDNLVDKVINVATYVEVMSSDSEEKIETSESMSSVSTQKTITVSKTSSSSSPALTDMAKWVRKEVSKTTTEIVKKTETKEEIRKIPKSLETPKKLNLSEIRKNFENKQSNGNAKKDKTTTTPTSAPVSSFNHNRFSSWDSVASSSSGVSSELLGTGTGTTTTNSESLQTIQSDFGSFSSFGSSHSLITPQDLQSIIDEADPPLETSEAFVVVLHRETPESSIGITLAGGSDYEAKEITIHRILTNSPADKDGRLKRGDRLLSINGLSMRGLTHRESLSVLKSPRTDVVMVVTRSKSVVKTNSLTKTKLGSLGSLSSLSERADVLDTDMRMRKTLHASRSVEDLDAISNEECNYRKKEMTNGVEKESNAVTSDIVNIIKDGTGIGIALDGGYDSPNGNKPLIVKKVFMGGAAEKLSNLKAGDEILEINGVSTEKQSRIDVWNMIKKLPQGESVQLKIKRK